MPEVDEMLLAPVLGAGRGHPPDGARRRTLGGGRLGGLRRDAVAEARVAGRPGPGGKALGKALGKAERTVASPRRALGLDRLAGHETCPLGVEARLSPRLGEQVKRRVPAARHAHQVAPEAQWRALHAVALVGEAHDLDTADPLRAIAADDGVAGDDVGAAGTHPVDHLSLRVRPRIDERHDAHAGVGEVDRRLIGAVVRGEEDRALTDFDGIAIQVRLRRRGEHDAGPVVVGEHQGPLYRPRRQHHLPGAHLPQALTRQLGRRRGAEVVGDALDDSQIVVIVIPEHRGARQQAHVGARRQFVNRVGDPVERRSTRDLGPEAQQRTAQFALLVGEDDARAGARRRERRREGDGT